MHFHTSSTFQTEELHPSYTFYSPSHSAAVGALDKKDLTTAVGDSLFNHTYDNTSAQCTLNMVLTISNGCSQKYVLHTKISADTSYYVVCLQRKLLRCWR